MIKDIHDFVNKNITYIAVILCLIAIWMIYNENIRREKNEEHMENIISSEIFNDKIVSQGKKINFRCNIDGVNYYLAQLPIQECEKLLDIECINYMMVLIPESTINSRLESYLKTLKTNMDICNATRVIKCKNNLIKPTEKKIAACETTWPQCIVNRYYIHDFNVSNVTKPDSTIKKYLFKGTATPDIDNATSPTMLNQHLVYDNGSDVLCGDMYTYGSLRSNDEYGEVIVSETVMNNTGIIGESPLIKVQLLFNTQGVIVGTNNITRQPKYIPINKKEYTYVGVCKDSKDIVYTCKSGSFEYKRVCLISENEKSLNNNLVLDFEPLIVV